MSDLEALLCECQLRYGHIQLFRNEAGWQASVYHYTPKTLTDSAVFSDPVQALRVALVDDDRKTRDMERKYQAQKPKRVMPADDDFGSMFE